MQDGSQLVAASPMTKLSNDAAQLALMSPLGGPAQAMMKSPMPGAAAAQGAPPRSSAVCSGRSSLTTLWSWFTAPADSFSAFRAPDTVTKAQQAVERKPAKPYTLNTQRTIVGESPHPPDGRPSPAGPSPAVSHPDTPVDHLLDEVRRPASRHKASLFFLESFFDQKVVQPAEPRSSKKRGFGDASEAVSAWSTDLDAGLVRSHSAGYAPLSSLSPQFAQGLTVSFLVFAQLG